MQAKLIITFEELSEPTFLAKAETISGAMAANVNFPAPWPAPLSMPATLTGLFLSYQSAYNAALTHDAAKIILRATARTALTIYLKKLAPYLEVVANGDLVKLLSTGYVLRQNSTPSGGSEPLPAPSDLKLKRGELSGVILATVKKLKGAGG